MVFVALRGCHPGVSRDHYERKPHAGAREKRTMGVLQCAYVLGRDGCSVGGWGDGAGAVACGLAGELTLCSTTVFGSNHVKRQMRHIH